MSEELDELASAYIDGEAAPDEVARVESTPELLDRVEEFRALRLSSLPEAVPDTSKKEQHLAAALAAFDELGEARPTQLRVVSSPTSIAASSPAEDSADDTARGEAAPNETVVPLERKRRRMPPAWLANAAAAVVIVGGVGFAVTQLPGGSDDDAADEVSFDDGGGDAAFDEASPSNGVSALERTESDTDDSMNDDAMEEEAAMSAEADDVVDEAEASAVADADAGEVPEDAADDGDDEAADLSSAPLLATSATATATEVLATFDAAFTDADLTTGIHPCETVLDSLISPASATMVGWARVDHGGASADLIVFELLDGRHAVLLSPDCGVRSSE